MKVDPENMGSSLVDNDINMDTNSCAGGNISMKNEETHSNAIIEIKSKTDPDNQI